MNAEEVLKISKDIDISKFDDKEYLLVNSKQNVYIKINDRYYTILSLIDGKRTLNEVKNEYNLLSFGHISLEHLIQLLEKLTKYYVFTDSPVAKKAKIPDYIKFGFIILKPAIVSKITPLLDIFFKRIAWVIALLVGFSFFTYNLYSNFWQIVNLNIISIIPYLFALTIISILFHEFGHATAAHHFGAKHGGIGGGFYIYYMPVFFANVTDIWRLKKQQRIVVNCAGVYFELIFHIFISLIALVLGNTTLQILATIILIKSFSNLVPFLRADGYWVLSDFFNKPNLSFHAFNNLKIIGWSLLKFRIPKFKYTDYLLAFYGFINVLLIVSFFYYNIFYNHEIILNFPSTLYHEILSLIKTRDFNVSIKGLFKYFSVLIFYFITIKLIIKAFKVLFTEKKADTELA